ncbi:MAG: YfhO family protein [Lachnospiraceae bacterium]|nr:YfhO family protein [Lachnospiraceae bacterium]
MKEYLHRFSWKEKYVYVLALLLPAVVFLLLMLHERILPFGNYSMLRGDGFTQLYAFLCEMHQKVHDGDSLFFSWNMGLGTNFYANWAYYLASPTNWLLMLLPMEYLEVGCIAVLLGKLVLCSVTMTFYFMHTYTINVNPFRRQLALLAGISYGVCNGVLCYSFLCNWLDAYWLLPLVLWALEKLLRFGEWKPYYLTLLLIIISNFYIAYSVCLFTALWFFVQADWKKLKWQFMTFTGTSLLSALSAGIVLVPVINALAVKTNYVNTEKNIWKVDSIWNLLNALLPFGALDMGGQETATYNIYCGCMIAMAALFWLAFGREPACKRLKFTILLLFMGFSLSAHFMSLLWHGGMFPRRFNNRYSFAFSFLLIYLGCQGIRALIDTTYMRIILWSLLGIGIFIGIILCSASLQMPVAYVSAMMIGAVFIILSVLLKRKSISKKVYVWIILAIGLFESLCSAYHSYNLPYELTRNHPAYAALKAFYEKQEDSDNRQALSSLDYRNAGTMFNRKIVTLFSTLTPENVVALYEKLGLLYMESGSVYAYRGSTPYTDLLMNVDYALTADTSLYGGAKRKSESYDDGASGIEENIDNEEEAYHAMISENSVGYGFMVEDNLSEVCLDDENAFHIQNTFFKAMGGKGILFEDVPLQNMEKEDTVVENGRLDVSFEICKDMDLYLFLRDRESSAFYVFLDEKQINQGIPRQYSGMIHVGEVKKSQVIHIQAINNSSKDMNSLYIYAAAFHQEVFDEFKNCVAEEAFVLEEMNGSGIVGSITAKKDGICYMSVPDDGGFTAYVDGQRTEHKLLADCMVCISVAEGEHLIELRYCPPGFWPGLVLSLLGICIALVFFVADSRKKSHC